MDPKLAQAAYSGNVNFLRESVSVCQKSHNSNYNCCFSTQHRPKNPKKEEAGNIFHLSGRNNRVDFFQEAIRILPDPIIDSLLTQREPNSGWNPLHVAAKVGHVGIVKLILGFYGLSESDQAQVFESKPWLAPDWRERTPFHVRLYHGRDECTMEMMRFLSFDDVQVVCNLVDKDGNSLLFLAVRKGCNRVALHILMYAPYYSLSAKNGSTPLHFVMNSSEQAAIWVAQGLLSLTANRDEFITHTLYSVSKNDKTKFVKWMLKNTSALRLAPLAWIEACHKGHFSTIMAFINNCEYFTELCFEKEDTPLHHIRFKVYEQYEDIMKNPIMSRLKNFQDFEGQTPLHKAVKNRDLLLTKLLLSMDDVFRSIKDKSHKTAMDLLVEACDESWEWDEMCKHIGIIPGVKMTYFQDKTNMLEVRNTLSVVAVLLATITFTAGFTLPGGVKSDTTGKATLGNKAAFLIFLIADALAMCCSMLVLVCLIWSMVCDYYKSLLLVNRSVPVLMLALYSTLVAFMSGVYVVIPHKSLWVAIVILVMCFTFIILSKRSVMDKLINKPYPARKYKDKFQMMEQGETSTSQEGSCSWICGKACTYLGGSNSQQQKSE